LDIRSLYRLSCFLLKEFVLLYRREIDGLRGIAVLAVILFHAGFSNFGGGFVGVDIFFVISGFLITSIILSELNSNNFSLFAFYERRARRILPVLFFVVLLCLPFALNWLSPNDLDDFSRTVSHLMVFSSNLYFTRTTGYFDVGSDLKPLLHTWSLSVEEQYYLLFPVFFVFIHRRHKSLVFYVLIALGILSLFFAEYYLAHRPATAFFLLPGRIWQLLFGAALAVQIDQGNLLVKRSEFGASLGFFWFFLLSSPSQALAAQRKLIAEFMEGHAEL